MQNQCRAAPTRIPHARRLACFPRKQASCLLLGTRTRGQVHDTPHSAKVFNSGHSRVMLAIPLLSTLNYPSLSGIEPLREFAILAPADNVVLSVPPNGTMDLSLRYVVRGFTGRLCLTLTHGQLRYYRGPVMHRDPSLLKRYAKGCFDAGQPITLQARPGG